MGKYTADVDHFDEDMGFRAKFRITAEIDPGSSDRIAEMIGEPDTVECLDASVYLAHGGPARCVPNHDETTREFGKRLWLNAAKADREGMKETWLMAFIRERDSVKVRFLIW